MRKTLLGVATLALLTFASCKKDDNNSNPTNNGTTPGGEWKVGSTVYKCSSVVSANNFGIGVITAVSTTQMNNSIGFTFPGGLPKANGTYTIASSGSDPATVNVVATDQATQGAYNVESGTVNVTLTNGKFAIKMAASPAYYIGMTGGSSQANTQISADVRQ